MSDRNGFEYVDIAKIVIGETRREIDLDKVKSLAESIAAIGLQHPISWACRAKMAKLQDYYGLTTDRAGGPIAPLSSIRKRMRRWRCRSIRLMVGHCSQN
jgi:hypothetical protein